MRIRCEIDLETDDGDYTVCFRNLSRPGEGMDYDMLRRAMSRVLADWQTRIDGNRQEFTGRSGPQPSKSPKTG